MAATGQDAPGTAVPATVVPNEAMVLVAVQHSPAGCSLPGGRHCGMGTWSTPPVGSPCALCHCRAMCWCWDPCYTHGCAGSYPQPPSAAAAKSLDTSLCPAPRSIATASSKDTQPRRSTLLAASRGDMQQCRSLAEQSETPQRPCSARAPRAILGHAGAGGHQSGLSPRGARRGLSSVIRLRLLIAAGTRPCLITDHKHSGLCPTAPPASTEGTTESAKVGVGAAPRCPLREGGAGSVPVGADALRPSLRATVCPCASVHPSLPVLRGSAVPSPTHSPARLHPRGPAVPVPSLPPPPVPPAASPAFQSRLPAPPLPLPALPTPHRLPRPPVLFLSGIDSLYSSSSSRPSFPVPVSSTRNPRAAAASVTRAAPVGSAVQHSPQVPVPHCSDNPVPPAPVHPPHRWRNPPLPAPPLLLRAPYRAAGVEALRCRRRGGGCRRCGAERRRGRRRRRRHGSPESRAPTPAPRSAAARSTSAPPPGTAPAGPRRPPAPSPHPRAPPPPTSAAAAARAGGAGGAEGRLRSARHNSARPAPAPPAPPPAATGGARWVRNGAARRGRVRFGALRLRLARHGSVQRGSARLD